MSTEKLLNSIAILVGTEDTDTSDVAAASMTNHAKGKGRTTILRYHFMKKRNYKDEEPLHFNEFVE